MMIIFMLAALACSTVQAAPSNKYMDNPINVPSFDHRATHPTYNAHSRINEAGSSGTNAKQMQTINKGGYMDLMPKIVKNRNESYQKMPRRVDCKKVQCVY